jgi:hypothetical protein
MNWRTNLSAAKIKDLAGREHNLRRNTGFSLECLRKHTDMFNLGKSEAIYQQKIKPQAYHHSILLFAVDSYFQIDLSQLQ